MGRRIGKAAVMHKGKPGKPAGAGLKVERVGIDTLRGDPANARQHGARNLEAIKDSLGRFGQQKPIVIDTAGVIRAGNGTWAAAKELGWTHLDVVRSDLPASELAAFAIADNRTAELAEWDLGQLEKTAAEFSIDLGGLGFSEGELAEMADGRAEHDGGGGGGGNRNLGRKRAAIVKVVLVVPDLATVECALRLTGKMNRGEALLALCEDYAKRHDDGEAKGQLDAEVQAGPSDQELARLAGGGGA